MKHHRTKAIAAIAAGAVALALAGCASTGSGSDDNVLRIAMGSPGEAQIRVWNAVADQFMKDNPDTKVEINFQDDDLYQTIGLPNLLNGRNAPDIYFEWAGSRLETRYADGSHGGETSHNRHLVRPGSPARRIASGAASR